MSTKLEKMRDELADHYYAKHLCSDKPSFKDGFDAADAHYRPIVEELLKALSIADEALLWSEEMFTARDEMNAKVHCAPVRLSPITERVKLARQALESVRGKL